MRARPALSALLDLAAGLVAITVVVGSCFAFKRVALDLRAMFAITGFMFFAAGLLRGSPERSGYAWRTVRVTAPGLPGTAALIVNNGLHHLEMPAGLILIAVFAAASAFATRAWWTGDRIRSLLIGCGALIAIAALSTFAVPSLSSRMAFVESRTQVAPFELSADGGNISSASLRGRVVVLAFWTSWCAPCLQEMPEIQQVYKRYERDPRIAFYAVDLGWHGETPDRGKKWVARHSFTVPMAFDRGNAAQSMGIDGIPAVVLMDGSGNLRFTHRGYDLSERMDEGLSRKIDALLAER